MKTKKLKPVYLRRYAATLVLLVGSIIVFGDTAKVQDIVASARWAAQVTSVKKLRQLHTLPLVREISSQPWKSRKVIHETVIIDDGRAFQCHTSPQDNKTCDKYVS